METPIFGKNLCNLLSNKIIKEFDCIDEHHTTEIKVIDLEQFIVLKGKTSINNSLNYSQLFKSYLNNLSGIDKNFNVIDLINYGTKPKLDFINLELEINKKNDYIIFDLNETIQGEYHIDLERNLILSTNNKIYNYLISNSEYRHFDFKNIDFDYPYVSDYFFGKSLNSDKIYEVYLKYISYNLFEKQLCKDIKFKMFYSGSILNLNWETMDFKVLSNSNIVSIDWIESLILDLFDFDYYKIKKHLSLNEYDFSNEILSKDKCWMVRDKTSEMILF